MTEPCFDVAHLGHVELYTDKFEESFDFFTNVYGLTESGRDGTSSYLRAFDDYEFHTLKLTRHHTTGVGHIGYRVSSPEALERRVQAIEDAGYGIGWSDGDEGHGRAYRFADPFGHTFELYWDTKQISCAQQRRTGAQKHRATLSRARLLPAPAGPCQSAFRGRHAISGLHEHLSRIARDRADPFGQRPA